MTDGYADVLKEVKEAYADCWMPFSKAQAIRNIHFKASRPVPSDVAEEILKAAIPRGYNQFQPSLLSICLGDVVIAREGSVCLYFQPFSCVPDPESLQCDEWDYNDGVTRVWWD